MCCIMCCIVCPQRAFPAAIHRICNWKSGVASLMVLYHVLHHVLHSVSPACLPRRCYTQDLQLEEQKSSQDQPTEVPVKKISTRTSLGTTMRRRSRYICSSYRCLSSCRHIRSSRYICSSISATTTTTTTTTTSSSSSSTGNSPVG